MTGPSVQPLDAVLLMGPTCTGKSALSLELAQRFPVEIVSVDSALVYRGMDIGTSKPSVQVREQVPHHLIDICDPAEIYSAGRFRRDAMALISAIRSRGRVPLLVGGTMLYFRALTAGIAPLPEADTETRAAIDAEARASGWPALHEQLALLDPRAAARIQPADVQRIQRALEVIRLTGRSLSELQELAEPSTLRLAKFSLQPFEREALYARINARFDEMMADGLLDEVRALHGRGDLGPDLPSMRAVGYRQLWQHLDGRCSLAAAVAEAQQATRNLAKRQLTWLRGDDSVQWLRSLEDQELVPIFHAVTRGTPGEGPAGLC
jgi:tRNA dimethylallyltransferase